MKPLLIIKAGTTFPNSARQYGDFEDWTIRGLGVPVDQVRVVDVYNNEPLPEIGCFSATVILGSHFMVTDHEPWCENLALWIPDLIKQRIPFLGLCFGHQLLAYAMGGEVGNHPTGKEIGTVQIQVNKNGTSDTLLKTLPKEFLVHVTHSQTVLRLPKDAVLLARNAFEPHHAIRIGDCAWGIQFHPEFDATIMRSYIHEQSKALEDEGLNPSSICSSVTETPHSAKVLQRFASIVRLGY